MSMNYIGKFFSNFKEFYNEINTATLTGAIDVIVVEQPDGTFNCSPFHVRFGKLGVLRSREKVVDIEINGEPQDIHMKLGESGEAFFVEEFEADDDIDIPEHLATSPIPVSEFENIFSTGRRLSLDLTEQPKQDDLNEVNDYKKRRNTADNETNLSTKVRERDFIKRQIGLGNLDIRENSVEDITLPSKLTNSNTNNSNSNSETISNYDSPDQIKTDTISSNKIDEKDGSVQTKNDDISNSDTRGSKKKRRKTKKKNAPRKSSSVSQLTNFGSETSDKNESTTDAASLDSSNSSSDPELKELQKLDNTNNNNANTPRKIIDPDFHFFSDTELTTNPNDLRSDLPIQIEGVQSDSEFEVKGRKGDKNNNPQSWEWGGFPIVTPTNSPTDEKIVIKNDQSVISNMFSFMKRNRQEEGMYLSDLNALNPKDAAVYFTTSKNERDMDCESGNGPSLTQSPNSADGCKSIDSDFEDHVKGTKRYIGEISMSLCGWEQEPDSGRFDEHAITFSDFCNNPLLIENSNLVVSIHGKFYNWKVAAPIMACLMVFNRPLLQSNIDQLCSLHMPSSYENKAKQEPKSSWWNWRRSKSSRETTPIVEIANKSSIEEMTPINTNNNINNNVTAINYSLNDSNNTTQKIESSTNNDNKNDSSPSLPSSPTDKFKKTLRLSSKQIASLNLRNGMNEIEFSVTTAYQGTSRCTCHLYKWKWDDKIVISDIDGTITKSDVLGHILPIVGKDWAQSGVAQLFNKIKDNGYKLLYLSARAIGQARITREYLKSIKQGDLTMPDGPILLNPTSLITAFHREVIEKKPEQFKISCMSDIKALFPPDTEPFYAGYGNRINDVWAYRAVGIPIVRIFTINPKGELKHELTQTFQSSYLCMTTYVDQLFPTLIDAANDYSQFVYWRDPIQHFDNVMEEI